MIRKFNYLWLSLLIVFFPIRPIAGQNIKTGEAFFKLPAGHVLVLKAIQTESPVQLEEVEVLTDKKAKMPVLNWRLTNNSSKTVKRFVVAFQIRTNIDKWQKFGGRTEYDVGTNEKNDLILPQKTYQEYDYSNSALLRKDEMSGLFSFDRDLDVEPFVIIYAMVRKVVFDDGSAYEADNKVFAGL